MLTPEQRILRARTGAYAVIAQGKTNTEPARRASPQSLDYWAKHVDPDAQLSEPERLKRATAARRGYFSSLALKSSVARRKAREHTEQAVAAERDLAEFADGAA